MNQTAVALYKVGGVLKEDARLLQKQDVDSDALPYLTEDVLTKMGVPTFGRRVKILKAAQAILAGAAGTASLNASTPAPLGSSQSVGPSSFSSSSSAPPARRQIEPEPDSYSREPSSSPTAASTSAASSSSGPSRGAPANDDAGEPDNDDDDMEREFEHPSITRANELAAKAAELAAAKAAKAAAGGGGEDDLFGTEEAATGDSFMAVKPWLGAMKEPSNPPKFNDAVPSKKLTIDWVHGFRAFDSRSNLVYNEAGDIVYPVAGLLVVANAKAKKQRYFQVSLACWRCLLLAFEASRKRSTALILIPLSVLCLSSFSRATTTMCAAWRSILATRISSPPVRTRQS